jgi:hypothetical protein
MRLHNPAYPEKFLLQVAIVGISIWRFVGPASLVTGESESAFPLPPLSDRSIDFGILDFCKGPPGDGDWTIVGRLSGNGFLYVVLLGVDE